jgi:hypothetical protein
LDGQGARAFLHAGTQGHGGQRDEKQLFHGK